MFLAGDGRRGSCDICINEEKKSSNEMINMTLVVRVKMLPRNAEQEKEDRRSCFLSCIPEKNTLYWSCSYLKLMCIIQRFSILSGSEQIDSYFSLVPVW